MTFLIAKGEANSIYSITNSDMIIGKTNDVRVARGDINIEIISHKKTYNKHARYDVNREDFLAINPRVFNKEISVGRRLGLIR